MNPLLHVPQFTLDQVAEVCGKPAATIRSWHTAEWLKLSEHDRPGRQGVSALLSLATVFRIAIASELMQYGLKPVYALYAAAAFSDTHADIVGRRGRKAGRQPGELFSKKAGKTVLIVWRPVPISDDDLNIAFPLFGNDAAKVVLVPTQGGIPAELFFKVTAGRVRQDSFIALNCNAICELAAKRLGTQPSYQDEASE
jgi:hypothetical protein